MQTIKGCGIVLLTLLMACEGPAGPDGGPGDQGAPGTPGDPGDLGRDTYLTGPGLVIELLDASVADGVATATVKITDEDGIPLDRDGRYSAGAVSLSFVIAHLAVDPDGDPGQYTSYITNAAAQASGESTGTFAEVGIAEGTYTYTFAAPIAVADATETHTIGVYGNRTFAEVRYGDDHTFNFVPDGSAVVTTRNVVDNGACASCHGELAAHGGARKSVELCITCHTGQSTDPDSGNTVDMRVMIHKIHRGGDLPSVEAGVPYSIVGFNNTVHDYSDVAFPHSLPDCSTCHRSEAANGDDWKHQPSVEACTSCHDDVVFTAPTLAWQTRHIGNIQPTDDCSLCHGATSGVAPLEEVHYVPELAADRLEPAITILSVTNTAPNQFPIVTFKVETLAVDTGVLTPRNLRTSPLGSLRATFAGPNTDFARYWTATLPTGGASPLLTDVDPANGVFSWTATAAIPADATGSYTVGLENYVTWASPAGGYWASRAITCPPTSKASCRIAGTPPRFAFAVTDVTPTARREVVSKQLCEACHDQLSFHGGGREDPNYCVMCHNANNVNEERVSRLEGASAQPYVHSVHLKKMVHGIHMGDELTQDYLLGANPSPSVLLPQGTMHNFAETRFPGKRSDCKLCHVGTTYRLPLSSPGLLPSFDQVFTCNEPVDFDGAAPDDLCEPFVAGALTNMFVPIETITYQPAAAACLGCHDAPDTVAHAWVMTTASGLESCATCHGPGAENDVDKVHGLR